MEVVVVLASALAGDGAAAVVSFTGDATSSISASTEASVRSSGRFAHAHQYTAKQH
jgi:hypothetical protein